MLDASHDNITVTELPDGPAGGGSVLGSVLGVYEQHGYRAGYDRAVQDVLLSLLGVTEDLIRQRSLNSEIAEELRRAVWAVGEELHRETGSATHAGFVEGGLGI